MLRENIKKGMMVCNAYSEHVRVIEIFEDGQIGCSDGYVWEPEDLDVADHTYTHLASK